MSETERGKGVPRCAESKLKSEKIGRNSGVFGDSISLCGGGIVLRHPLWPPNWSVLALPLHSPASAVSILRETTRTCSANGGSSELASPVSGEDSVHNS